MIPLRIEDIAALELGRLEPAAGVEQVTGVKIDSRRIEPGDLFVAAGRGTDYLDDARAQGAAATLVPDDAFAALAGLGRSVRARSSARVVGITGSTGKTSTKDILHALCAPRARTIANERSYNAELGVPLTLCRLEIETEICIVELAMRGFGQIAYLCDIARPAVGVVTNVGPAHLALVGSIEGVRKAKTELIDALPTGGIAVVPEDFPVARRDLDIRRFGQPDARVEDGSTILRFDDREIEFGFTARHHARNALAALHAAQALAIDAEGPVDIAFSAWRGEEVELPGGGLLIVDCWNANPVSMTAALEHLAACAAGRRLVAIIGDMAELGAEARTYHLEIGHLARSLGVAALVAVGEEARAYLEGGAGIALTRWVVDAEAATSAADEIVQPGDCVLVKGSRAVGLEAVAEALTTVNV